MPSTANLLVASIAFAVLAANLVATARVLRCGIDSAGQKAAQLAIVWLLPILGAAIALLMSRERMEPGSGSYPGPKEELEEVAVSKPNYEAGAD